VTVIFTVTDSLSGTGTETIVVMVENLAPTATFSNKGPVSEGSAVSGNFSNPSDHSSVDVGSLHYFIATIQAAR
jgi:hypothetical protein